MRCLVGLALFAVLVPAVSFAQGMPRPTTRVIPPTRQENYQTCLNICGQRAEICNRTKKNDPDNKERCRQHVMHTCMTPCMKNPKGLYDN